MLKLASFFQISRPHPGRTVLWVRFFKVPNHARQLASKRNFAVFLPSPLKFGFLFSNPSPPSGFEA